MIKEGEVYKIGQINKPHGIHGELQFTFTDDVFDRADCDYLICKLDGILVPFFIEEYRFRSNSTALMKFQDVDSVEYARRFTNVEVFFPLEYVDEVEAGDVSWNFFVGFLVRDVQGGDLGEIEYVDDTTENVLFLVKNKDKELLIPAHEEFIVEIDQMHKVITVSLPEGLLSLSES